MTDINAIIECTDMWLKKMGKEGATLDGFNLKSLEKFIHRTYMEYILNSEVGIGINIQAGYKNLIFMVQSSRKPVSDELLLRKIEQLEDKIRANSFQNQQNRNSGFGRGFDVYGVGTHRRSGRFYV